MDDLKTASDFVTVKGIFKMTAYGEGGIKLFDYLEKNMVVTVGKQSLASLLAGAGSGKEITKVAFGTNGAAPSLTDTSITNPFVKTVAAVSYPIAGQVQFDWVLDTAENNGIGIREFGLLSNDGTLFARKIRDVFNKTNLNRLEGSWIIQF